MLPQIVDFLRKEKETLRGAPLTFVGSAILFLVGGLALGHWYFSGQIDAQREQIKTKDGEIQRYQVVIGIKPGTGNALVELTDSELQLKAFGLVERTRVLCRVLGEKTLNLENKRKNSGTYSNQLNTELMAARKETAETFDSTLRSDFLNTESEVLRRIDPKSAGAVMRFGPPLRDDETGALIPLQSVLAANSIEGAVLCEMAAELEQLAKILPTEKRK